MTVERRSGQKPKSRRGKRGGKRADQNRRKGELGYGDGREDLLPRPWMQRFLVVLRRTGNVSTAAKRVGMSRQGCYLWREKNEHFGALWDDAVEDRYDVLEQKLYERAAYGWDEPVFGALGGDMGTGEVGVRRKFDNRLGQWFIERARPVKEETTDGAADMAAAIRGFLEAATGSVPSTKATEAKDWGAQRLGDAVDEEAPAASTVPTSPDAELPAPHLRLCVECGTLVDPEVPVCPNCGADPRG